MYPPIFKNRTEECPHKKIRGFSLSRQDAEHFATALAKHSKRKGKTFAKIANDDWTRKF